MVAWVIDHRGVAIGERVKWAVRPDTRQPAWNSARNLALPPLSYRKLRRAVLHAQVWDHDPLLPPKHDPAALRTATCNVYVPGWRKMTAPVATVPRLVRLW